MLPTISLDVNTELRLDLILVCLHSHGAAVAWMKEMSNFLFVFNDVIFKKKNNLAFFICLCQHWFKKKTVSVSFQLCYLHADLFKNLSAKETKKHFVEFCNTFLDKGAVSSITHIIL